MSIKDDLILEIKSRIIYRKNEINYYTSEEYKSKSKIYAKEIEDLENVLEYMKDFEVMEVIERDYK